MRPLLFTLLAGFLVPQIQAATFRNSVFSLNAPPGNSGCAAPPPSDYFESSDTNMIFWFDMANMSAGDVVTIRWSTSAGRLDSSSRFQPLSSSGGHCFWITQPIGGNSAASVTGIWNYSVLVNNNTVFTKKIQVVGPNDSAINRGGVVNTASGVSRAGMIAAGSLVSIFGRNLSPVSDQAGGAPLPTNLDGVTVTFNGKPVGIVAVASGEVDVQAPWGIASDTVFVQVNNNGTLTNTERVRVASTAPGIFYDNSTSANAAFVYRFGADGSDGGWVGPDNPLLRGDTAVFLATGLGAVADPPANFDAGNSDSVAVLPVTVAFGGARSSAVYPVLDSGTGTYDVGVTWIYATVPAEAPNGAAVPISIGVAGAMANTVAAPVGGAVPAVNAPRLLSIAGYPAVNAGGGYNPLSAISINANGVYPNVRTYARFADNTGYSVTVPAMAVYSDRVIAVIPPYVDQKQHKTVGGTVQCSILQVVAGQILASNTQTLQIGPLVAAPGATGHLTAEYLATLAQDARAVNGGYTYKQEISNGRKFTAVSANQFANAMVTGLQPLVGGAIEVANGSAGSIDLGGFSIDSNTLALSDALIAAALRENAKAYQTPLVVTQNIVTQIRPNSVVGSLFTYFGKVAQCNMPWNQISDEVNGTSSNCPTPTQALHTVIGAAKDSLREAVDSTLEDAKRFAHGPGLFLGLLAGGEGVAIVEKLAHSAAAVQVATHVALLLTDSQDDATVDQKAALETIKEELVDKLKDLAVDATGIAVGSLDEQAEKEWEKAKDDPLGKVAEQWIENMKDAPATLEGPRDETDSDGSNSLNDSVDNAPAIEITGKVTNGAGAGLQNVGVELTDGNATDTPIATGPTNTDGTFDMLIPLGANVPATALFQITALDEDGDIATFDGNTVNIGRGSQSIGTSSISYDNDDDGDDDSDGSLAVFEPIAGQSTHRAPRRHVLVHAPTPAFTHQRYPTRLTPTPRIPPPPHSWR
jgi:uncharacterized protein (TIGR03437 family)